MKLAKHACGWTCLVAAGLLAACGSDNFTVASGTGATAGAGGTSGSSGTAGTGAAGAGGTSGTSGTSGGGSGGTSGSSGSGGTSGASGSGGTAGASGSGGTAGSAGSGGTAGASGSGGTSGASGSGGTAGSTGCGADGTPCTTNGKNGLCSADVCSLCSEPQDDGACTQAYGTAQNTPYLCLNNSCTPGDCRTSNDCSITGQTCGGTAPNFCGACTNDGQCQAAFGPSQMCDVNEGICIPSTCTTSGQVCTANPADFCCAGASPTGNACVAGNCCHNNDCPGPHNVCLSYTCATCDPVGGTIYVDPINGNDNTATGSNSAGGATAGSCAYKTITKALSTIPASSPTPITVMILGTATIASGETFPLNVPTNVTISTQGGVVTILVPANATAFNLAKPLSGIDGVDGLVLDGAVSNTNSGLHGVNVTTGTDATTVVKNLTIKNMAGTGIEIASPNASTATLSIKKNVDISNCGLTTTDLVRRPAIHVGSGGVLDISVPASQLPTRLHHNTAGGIGVEGTGIVTIKGTPGDTLGTGSVLIDSNTGSGIILGSSTSKGSIDGVVSWGNLSGSGIRVAAGVEFSLRNSVLLANAQHGVHVNALAGSSTNVSGIDLGSGGEDGLNRVQASAADGNVNGGAGICLSVTGGTNLTLSARGNIFSSTTDCSLVAGMLLRNGTCTGAVDVGITALSAANQVVDTTKCAN